MKSVQFAQYTFSFKATSENVNENDFEEVILSTLSQPEKAKSVLVNPDTYSNFFEHIEHQEEDYVCKTYEILEYVVDFDTEKDDVFLLGFNIPYIVNEETIKSVYKNVIIPLVEKTGKFVSENKISYYIEYKETESGSYSI